MKPIESAAIGSVSQQLLDLLPVRRGHFQYESGHHSDLWLELDKLFARPAELRPFVNKLARQLAAHGIAAVCGPMIGGALVAQMIAAELGIEFYFTERIASPVAENAAAAAYRFSEPQQALIRGKSVAIVDDAINAGSAVGGTLAAVRAAGAKPVVVGALVILGTAPEDFLAAQKMPLERIATLSSQLWPPADCPLCAAGVALDDQVNSA